MYMIKVLNIRLTSYLTFSAHLDYAHKREKSTYEMQERIEALRLFRGNGEDVRAKLQLIETQLPPINHQKPCLDADLEVISQLC
jgi:hypothetical protein